MIKKNRLVVKVGDIYIGGHHPVVIQSMTNTDTENIEATVEQTLELWRTGSEIVRITVNTEAAAQATIKIKEKLLRVGCNVPLVGDFHFNGHKLLKLYPDCAKALDKYRINPGNVGKGSKREDQFSQMIQCAIDHDKPVRIGVNWGSLDQDLLAKMMDENQQLSEPKSSNDLMREALIQSALLSAEAAVKQGLAKDRIIISCKTSDTQDLIFVYEQLAKRCNYPLHLGITEAGSYFSGSIKSSIGLGMLLYQGIGDTIRVSLSDHPTQEVKVGFEMLKSLNLRDYGVTIISCPSCARQQFDVIKTVKSVESRLSHIKKPITVSIIGCVVNGPGEATMTNIGITGGGNDTHMVYVDGEKSHRIQNEDLVEYLVKTIENKVEEIHN